MANDEHVAILKKGVDAWNAWREKNPDVRPDLNGVHLDGADNLERANLRRALLNGAALITTSLERADLRWACLIGANLGSAYLTRAKLSDADLRWANLDGADLRWADLREADLSGASLNEANLARADLRGATVNDASLGHANLRRANLRGACLIATTLLETDFTDADLTGCHIYGVSAWALKLDGAAQKDLVITHSEEPKITVDNIEVAQFIYLLLHNEKIRDVIDTIGKKGVLLLGRFTEGRMVVLERLRDKLRDLGFVPMVFNFDKPETKDFTETVRLLASLSKFVIVDITNPRSAPLELQATVPDYMVPFVPILQQGEQPFAMFVDANPGRKHNQRQARREERLSRLVGARLASPIHCAVHLTVDQAATRPLRMPGPAGDRIGVLRDTGSVGISGTYVPRRRLTGVVGDMRLAQGRTHMSPVPSEAIRSRRDRPYGRRCRRGISTALHRRGQT